MKIEVFRYKHTPVSLGVLSIDGVFECYTLEDQRRAVKVMHETCIPPGEYEIKLRTEGTHHEKYKKYPVHQGMLHLQDVPNFQYILIHIGNLKSDSSGCILVGQDVNGDSLVGSTNAYITMYTKVISAFKRGEKVTIKITEWH